MFMVTKLGDRGVDSSGENRRGVYVSLCRYGGGDFQVVAGIALPCTGTQGTGRGHNRPLGCHWWGRTTSGQAIYMDDVIRKIAEA